MDNKHDSLIAPERMHGVNSLFGVGEVACDKCGKPIRHMDRYCYSAHECPICGATLDSMAKRDSHFSQQHPSEMPKGARYCVDCSFKAGFLKMVRNKKTGEVFPAMFVSRDEEVITGDLKPSD